MSDIAIRVENLSKQYRIGQRERYYTLRDTLANLFTRPFRRSNVSDHKTTDTMTTDQSPVVSRPVVRGQSSRSPDEFIWALKDVRFEVKHGEVVGIIGRNGAGKTTLLKILSRITEPTEGSVNIQGRVGSLLEVGTGFHPELTGRENIYLNGAILGMKKAEIDRKFDEIVAFAEVEKFIDTPIKHYSSGMYVRLAFAVAAHLNPEILLVDEVLAVGDAAFQEKCLGKMEDIAGEGRTVLFVSHNTAAVRKLCPRALILNEGRVALDRDSATAIAQYLGAENRADGRLNLAGRHSKPKHVAILNAWLEKGGVKTTCFLFDDTADLIIEIEVEEATLFGVELTLRQGDRIPVAFAPSGLAQDWEIKADPGTLTVRARLSPLRFARGPYAIDIMLAESGVRPLDYIESAITFTIDSTSIGNRNWTFSQTTGQGHQLWDVTYQICNHQEASS